MNVIERTGNILVHRVVTLFKCFECATLTPNLPDASDVALCDRHKDPTLLFCQEVHSEFRQD